MYNNTDKNKEKLEKIILIEEESPDTQEHGFSPKPPKKPDDK